MRDKSEYIRDLAEKGIHLSKNDPILMLYDFMELIEKDFIKTYLQISVEIKEDVKKTSNEYSKGLVDGAQKYAEIILEAARNIDLQQLKSIVDSIHEKTKQEDLPKVEIVEHKTEVPDRMNQLFFANICVLILNLVLFFVATYL